MNRIEVINPNFKGVSTLITLLDLDVVSLEKWLLMFANVVVYGLLRFSSN
jgi:hypothetical protein